MYSEAVKMYMLKMEQSDKSKMLYRYRIIHELRVVLIRARLESRLICGLLPVISYLDKNPGAALFCVIPEIGPGNAAAHMQSVLLQAFCYENNIPIIQVNSSEHLSDLCGISATLRCRPAEFFCTVITSDPRNSLNLEEDHPLMSTSEQTLTDFYECTIDEYPRPVIHLPPFVTA